MLYWIMLNQRYSGKDAMNVILQTINKYVDKNQYKVFLFGSRADNTGDETSDYDIGVLGKEKVPYSLLLKIWSDLRELPYRVDFVDFNRVKDSFKDVALTGIVEL